MSHATVADVVTQAQGQTLTLRDKDGEKTLNVLPAPRALAGRDGFRPPV